MGNRLVLGMINSNLNSKTLLLAIISCFVLFASCGKDPDDPQDDPQVNDPDPVVASFTISNDNCTGPCTVQFTNTSTGASTYSWDFGDGATSTSKDPDHQYSNAGSYSVSMTATGDGGNDTETSTVTIAAPPAPTYFIRYTAGGTAVEADTLDVTRGSAANPRNFNFRGVNTGGQPEIEIFVEESFIGWSAGLNIGFHDGTAPFTMVVTDGNGKVYSSLNTPSSIASTMFLSAVDYSAGGEMAGTFSGSLVATDGSDTLRIDNGSFNVVFLN